MSRVRSLKKPRVTRQVRRAIALTKTSSRMVPKRLIRRLKEGKLTACVFIALRLMLISKLVMMMVVVARMEWLRCMNSWVVAMMFRTETFRLTVCRVRMLVKKLSRMETFRMKYCKMEICMSSRRLNVFKSQGAIHS